MKHILLFLLLLPLGVVAQETKAGEGGVSPSGNKVFTFVETPPVFPGGEVALYNFLKDNKKYTDEAKAANIEGLVIARFIVDVDGTISNPVIVKKLGFGLDEEAIRVIKLLPKFTPGKQAGKPIATAYTLPFRFPQ